MQFDEFQFPPLEQCAVIDSRFSSRQDIVRDLKATGLFQNIDEAQSVRHGLEMLNSLPVDACIIGPSVSPGKMIDLIERSREIPAADSCAFVAIVPPDSEEEDFLLDCGVHGVLRKPYTKHSLNEKIVRSVVRANANSPWKALLKRYSDEQADAKNSQQLAAEASEESRSEAIDNREIILAIENTIPALKELSSGHERGEFGLLLNGSPTPATMTAIDGIVEKITGQRRLPATCRKDMADFLGWSIVQWFGEMVIGSEESATKKLRSKLISYASRTFR